MVSVIILSYNTEELLHKCLRSIVTFFKDDYEIIVVDNASTDQSVNIVKKSFPHIRIVENEKNVGFAKGVNIGAQKAKGEYLLLLNSDTEVDDDSYQKMIQFINTHPDAAVVGGELVNTDRSTSKSYGKFYSLRNVWRMLFQERKQRLERNVTTPTKVDWVSGGFMLIKKAVFDTIGGFDEHFFMYMEDMELCYRLHRAGYGIYYFPEARIVHKGQGSSNRSFAVIQIYKGLTYFYKKHKSVPEQIVLLLLLVTKSITAVTIGVLTNNSYLKDTYGKALHFVV